MSEKTCDNCQEVVDASIAACLVCEGKSFTYINPYISANMTGAGQHMQEDFYDESYEYKHSLNKTIRDGNIPLSTTFEINGKEIKEHLALITGVGNARFTLTGTNARLTNRAATKAINNLLAEAKRIEADAVIGVNFNIDTYGTAMVNQLVVVSGTAVKLKK
jgi:uncharacterized protein YbjQ (UPF0145 family)